MTGLRMFTIYDHPRDHPGAFVVREWEIGAGTMTSCSMWTAPTLEAARDVLPPGLVRLERDVNDDPVIVETWT